MTESDARTADSIAELPDDQLRAELQAWLRATMAELHRSWPSGAPLTEDEDIALRRRYAELLGRDGWASLSWPTEWGGRGGTMRQQLIFVEESIAAGAPVPLNRLGVEVIGPAIMAYGTDAQRRHYLPRILSLEDLFCQGFSEPNAGSDLASLRMRATRTEDGWRIDGQKTWTSIAHSANLCFVLARTDPDVPKHRGISAFVVDMRAPGVAWHPIEQINGAHEFCDVFFDDVAVSDDALVGEPGQGWPLAMTALGFERSIQFIGSQIRLGRQVEALVEQVRRHRAIVPSRIKDRVVDLYVKSAELRATVTFHIESLNRGEAPGPANSATKVFWSELWQELADIGAELEAEVPDARAGADIDWSEMYVGSRVGTIYAGTNEIQRNIIAERALGLPR
jgi:alkylation response protein AidB-like acyl-CoA dehydrogenase